MKQSKQCPKCKSLRIGYLKYQTDEDGQFDIAARHAGIGPHEMDGVARRIGLMEAYVCTDCGYYESYVKDPHMVEWSELAGFSPINSEHQPEGPYRGVGS